MVQNKIDSGECRLVDMYSKFQLTEKWFQYIIHASNRRGHGTHSPFVYQFIREVLNDNRKFYAYDKIEAVRASLLRDQRMIPVYDFGAGSTLDRQNNIKVSEIASRSLSSKKFGRLLFRLADFYRARNILELGSSLGISTGYLAKADPRSRVTTLEGSPAVSGIAAETFQKLGLDNVNLLTGKFEESLEGVLTNNPDIDLVFLDGNHRKKPVLDYFEQILNHLAASSLFIIHDIHWSSEMEEAWTIIQKHPSVKITVDIFSAGLVFFREDFQVRQHFKIRF